MGFPSIFMQPPFVSKAHKQIDHRRFSRARGSYYRHLLSRFYFCGKIFDYRFVGCVGVGETYMVELHFTVNVFAESRFFVLVFEFLTFEKIKKCGEPKRTPSAYLSVPALSAQGAW